MVVLNSACSEVGGCGQGSPQMEWLRADLAANPAECTAAYFHIPRFSSGKKHGDDLNYVALWQVLYEHGVEFVMGGNDHHYERFAPQTPYGDLDLTDGIRQFVVGTGGRFLRPVTRDAAAQQRGARRRTPTASCASASRTAPTSGSSCPWTAARTRIPARHPATELSLTLGRGALYVGRHPLGDVVPGLR